MYFLTLATAFLSCANLGVFASPAAAAADGHEIVVRSPDGLETRTWWGHDPGCNDWWKKSQCALKGKGWFCNNKCDCDYHPPQEEGCKQNDIDKCKDKGKRYQFDHAKCDCKHVGCPSGEKETCQHKGKAYDYNSVKCECEYKCHESKKTLCDKKGSRYQFDHANCDCVDKGCPADAEHACQSQGKAFKYNKHACHCEYECSDLKKKLCQKKGSRYSFDANNCDCVEKGCDAHEKHACLAAQGTYNDHECKCTPKKNDGGDKCGEKRDECSKFGWGCNDRCECTPPAQEQCKDWFKALICYKLGKKCDGSCRCY